jgi:hypothetical protein
VPSIPSPNPTVNPPTFNSYEESSNLSHNFSVQHINLLTIRDAMSFQLPEICHGRFKLLAWSAIIPDDDIFTLDKSQTFPPSIKDIHPILTDTLSYFKKGM